MDLLQTFDLFRLLLILLIVIILFYVLNRLFIKRQTIIALYSQNDSTTQEGFDTALDQQKHNDVVKLNRLGGINIKNINADRFGMSLSQYCIKSSYSSAFSGNYVSTEMVKYVLSRGCRLLDFGVYYSPSDGIPIVAHSTDSNANSIDSNNTISLNDVFSTIVANAFAQSQTGYGSPNPNDPLFIHLRVYTDEQYAIYDKIADLIQSNFSNMRYVDSQGYAIPINNHTIVDDSFNRKVFILMNKTLVPRYASKSQKLAQCVNGETGGNTFRLQTYAAMENQMKNTPTVLDDGKKTNIVIENIVIPDTNEQHVQPSLIDMIVDHGVQMTMYKYYNNVDNLAQHEDLFNQYLGGIIPMSYAILYLKQVREDISGKTLNFGAI